MTTNPTSFAEYAAAMSSAQANRITALQRWAAAVGPMTRVEADQLAAVLVNAAASAGC